MKSAVLLASVASATAAAPSPYLGIEEMVDPSLLHGNQASLNLTKTFEDGRRMHLSYEVEHADNAYRLHLDLIDGLGAVECPNKNTVNLVFDSQEASDAVMASIADSGMDMVLVSGGKQWGCTKLNILEDPSTHEQHTERTGIILRRSGVPTQSEEDPATLSLHTERANYHDMFKNAKIRFRTNAFPGNFTSHGPPKEQLATTATPALVEDPLVADLLRGPKQRSLLSKRSQVVEDRRQLGFFKSIGSAFKSVTKTVAKVAKSVGKAVVKTAETVVNDIEDAVDIVEDGIDLLVSGDLSEDPGPITLAQFGWNYANGGADDSSIEITTDVYCEDCYAHAELDLLLELDVSDYKVSYFKIAAEGSFAAALTTTLSASYSKSYDYSKVLTTLSLPSITFSIGAVPVSLDFSAPINIGIDADISANGAIKATASVSGDATYGVQYSSGSWSWIHDKTFSADGGLKEMSATVTAAAKLWVEPVITLTVEHIGGPTFSIMPHLDVTAVGEVDQDILEVLGVDVEDYMSSDAVETTDQCPEGVSVTVSAGIDADLGAQIDIEILNLDVFKKTWDPTSVFSVAYPITSGCYEVSTGRNLRRGLVDVADITPVAYDGVEAGDLFYGFVTNELSSKCLDLYGGSPATYLHMHMRVAAADKGAADDGADVYNMITTVNYADTGEKTGSEPFVCLVQNMLTWETHADGNGVMVLSDDQDEVNYTSCSNGYTPDLEFICNAWDGDSIDCSDTSACIFVELRKDYDAAATTETPLVVKRDTSKCYYLSNTNDCTSTSGCGWCEDETGAAGCISGRDTLPTVTQNGDNLKSCRVYESMAI